MTQQAWQSGRLGAHGNTVMVHYDHAAKRAAPLPEAIRVELQKHVQEPVEAES